MSDGIFIFGAMSKKEHQDLSEVRVTGVSEKTHEELKNIAHNNNVTLSNFLRPKLTEIANSYPDHMKTRKKDD